MVDKVIETGVDQLINLVKEKKKISIVEAAKEIKTPLHTVQKWVDFLVEEKILGIEYKFTVPHIYLNKDESNFAKQKIEELKVDLQNYKDAFIMRARANSIPEIKIIDLWKNHLINELEFKKPFFYNEARKRGIAEKDVDKFWEEYKNQLLDK
ncbi:MAG: hypothetical protein QXG00_03265 [Candidatus Woesearchaeota archaeon]